MRRTPPWSKYIDAVAEVEKAIEEIQANMTDDERAEVEAQEAAENTEPEAAPAEDEKIEEEHIQLRGETKTCPVCKAEGDGDALFCNHCGAQRENTAERSFCRRNAANT